jgi:hypothetical protein
MKKLLTFLTVFHAATTFSTAQYGISIMNPDYYAKHKIKSVKVMKQFGEEELNISYYQYDAKTRIIRITFYETPERAEEVVQVFKLTAKDNFLPLDPETMEELGDPYRFKLVDHFMYDYYEEWNYSQALDSKNRVVHDTIDCINPDSGSAYRYLRYDFTYDGDDLDYAYYWEYDLLGFPNDIQRTDYTWSEDHLRLESRTRPLENDDLVAHLERIIPYTIIWIYDKDGLLVEYESEDRKSKEEFRFVYAY